MVARRYLLVQAAVLLSMGLTPLPVGAAGVPVLSEPSATLPAGAPADAAIAQPVGTTRMVTLRSNGHQTKKRSHRPVVNANGRFVAFSSRARQLVDGETIPSESLQVYVRDMETRTTLLVSRGRDGGEGNADSDFASISADGTRIVFNSGASNLARGDTNGISDVYLYDTTTQRATLISRAPDGSPGNGSSTVAVISADGRHVVFTSSATNLAPGGDPGITNVFLYDVASGTMELISRAPNGDPANYYSYRAWISGDGSRVSYRSGASNLVSDDTKNSRDDIFLYDAAAGTTTLISRTPDGGATDYDSADPMISADGTRISYFSYATNLVPGDSNRAADVFVYDIATAKTTLISRARDGGPANGESYYPTISGDGTLIAFSSIGTNLVRGDDNGVADIFVHDTATASTQLVSRARDGSDANNYSDRASISVDSSHIAYESRASNLVRRDTDDLRPDDVFLYRLP